MSCYDVPSIVYLALEGVTRSKRLCTHWLRKAADNGCADSCLILAGCMYRGSPHARQVGHVGEAAGVATLAGVMDGHDVPPDVLTSVVHWLRKGCSAGQGKNAFNELDGLRRSALEGDKYCHNEGCEFVGHLKEFKVCPQCKTARYCGDVCQKEDWTTGGHKGTCGTAAAHHNCR